MSEPSGKSLQATEQAPPAGSSAHNTAPVTKTTSAEMAATAPALTAEQHYRAIIAFLETENAQLRANSSADQGEEVQAQKQSQTAQVTTDVQPSKVCNDIIDDGVKFEHEFAGVSVDGSVAVKERAKAEPQRQTLDAQAALKSDANQIQGNNSIIDGHRIKIEGCEPENQMDFEPETTVPTATASTKKVIVKKTKRKPSEHQRQGYSYRISKAQHKKQQNNEAAPTGKSLQCNNCRKWGHTQHQCPEPKRVRQQTATGPKTQGTQQTKLAPPSISQTL